MWLNCDMTNIILVDDENSIRISVSMALESEGFKVDVFPNGLEALKALETKSYDLGLFDIKTNDRILDITGKEFKNEEKLMERIGLNYIPLDKRR